MARDMFSLPDFIFLLSAFSAMLSYTSLLILKKPNLFLPQACTAAGPFSWNTLTLDLPMAHVLSFKPSQTPLLQRDFS